MTSSEEDNSVNFLFLPKVSFFIFIISLIVYLVLLDDEGAFKNSFLKFGPDANTKFFTPIFFESLATSITELLFMS